MGNSIKFKIGICIVAALILVVSFTIQNNFYQKVTYKKWGVLEWKDFNGISKPFTSFSTAIFSDIYLEYDTINESYIAYAAQNNQKSWKKEKDTSQYLLNHEQYHFNIAEIFAKKMNRFIKDYPDKDLDFYNKHLLSLKIEEREMQDQYDYESDHSISIVNQSIWEYKIDSLLQLYNNTDGYVIDYYSGAKAYFPEKPKLEKSLDSIDGQYSSRIFILEKYNMEFLLMSFQYLVPEFDDIEKSIKEFYKENEIKIKSFKKSKISNDIKILVTAEDTLYNDYIKNLWLYSNNYFYKLTARYPAKYGSNPTYTKIADNFINSFEVIETDSYWRKKFQSSELEYKYRDLKQPQSEDSDCLVYSEENQYVFFKGPIYFDDDSFVIVQDIPNKLNRDIKYSFLILNNFAFQYEKGDTVDHFLFVPKEKLIEESFLIEFGYVPIEANLDNCYNFNYQSLKITPPPQTP